MAIKHLIAPWTLGGAVVVGYAAFAWLREKRGKSSQLGRVGAAPTLDPRTPLSDQLERVPEDLALPGLEALPSAGNAQNAELGAVFLGRVTSALSPFSRFAAEPAAPPQQSAERQEVSR